MRIVIATLVALASTPAAAFDLDDLFQLESQAQARAHNVEADNAAVYDVAPPVVVMADFGTVARVGSCLPGADCSSRPIAAGNYLWARERAPWLVFMSYVGRVSTDADVHPEGHTTALNVIDTPASALRVGGMRVRVFGLGSLEQTLR